MITPGAIAWLDFRRDDLTRARDLIRSLQDEGLLDELGYLAMQGAFADQLYPATSTLMTSARYLYFVSAIYRWLETQGFTSTRIDREARRKMDELRDVLSRNEGAGVIGREAKAEIQRPPSALYWNSLRLLGFFGHQLSEAGYQSRFDELRQGRRFTDDDKAHQSSAGVTYWGVDLPSPRFLDGGLFRDNTDFKLRLHEARDLAARFRTRFPASLLTHLLDLERADFRYPWLAPTPPAELAPYLKHAEALSLFATGTTLQYTALVVEERARFQLPVHDLELGAAFGAWWDAARAKLRAWEHEELARLPKVAHGLRHGAGGDLKFIEAWKSRLEACRSAAALFADAEALRLIRRRELDIKPAKARLKHRKHLEQWNVSAVSSSPYLLTYRHAIGSSFAADILAGLEAAE
jgi:hypothetical protein